jgi:Domain of unknown function (DUF3846)
MALLVKSDGTIAIALPLHGGEFTLTELQTFVGGYIELVKIHGSIAGYEGEFDMMFCNEEGKLKGLPINLIATALYVNGGIGRDLIVGDVLICKHGEVS